MKGKVLGFDAAAGTGAITGEDSQRYSFTTADFKSPGAVKAGDSVDFQGAAGVAKDIYVTAGGASVDLSSLASNATVASILAKPNLIWAAIIILGSLIAGYLSTLGLIGGGPMGMYGSAGFVLALLFLVPVAAGVLIFFELTNHAMTAQFRLVTAAIAIAGPILLPVLAGSMIGGGIFDSLGIASDYFGFAITPGKLITVGGGVLILLTHFGVIKKLG